MLCPSRLAAHNLVRPLNLRLASRILGRPTPSDKANNRTKLPTYGLRSSPNIMHSTCHYTAPTLWLSLGVDRRLFIWED